MTATMDDVSGDTAPSLLVFGGGSGIGLAAVRLAAGRGDRVTVADLDPVARSRLAELGQRLGAEIGFIECDVTDGASVAAAVGHVLARHGQLDQVLTTVGGATIADVPDLDQSVWDRELSFNLTSAYHVAHCVLPVLAARGAGALVLTSSGQAVMAATDRAGYAAAKAGVISLTRSLAGSVAARGVRVNCLAPGPTDTPRFRAMNGGDEGVEAVRAAMPMGWIPQAEDCAEVALFLLSDAARAVTGQTVHVNGGLLMP
ncbi:SDR family NAD(P)-dependent oxidoreductase [Streptomyces sp. 6N223]|uniref:SDR family NAD(P)-dependent oxidoreductase n=1 Tax=Streptomyces sp. 6N223 TaxID=3457412 RepID=UPI003FD3396E